MKKIIGFLFILIPFLACSQEKKFTHPKVKWKFKSEGPIRAKVVINDRKIFMPCNDGVLYVLQETDGKLIWKFKTDGAICSSPMVEGNKVFISSRDEYTYALDTKNGSLLWKFKSGETLEGDCLGWDYFTASPVIYNNLVLIGAGDGYLYAVDKNSGKKVWNFKTNGRIRAAPTIYNGKIFQPSNDGYIYALNSNDGNLEWKFETEGAHLNSANFGFDRNSIFTKPFIQNNILVIGSRDGHVYAVDLNTHKEKWRFSYGSTWAQNVVVDSNTVFVGWSTNNMACAIDLETGKKTWEYKCGAHVYNDMLVVDDQAIFGSADGNLYALDKNSGKKNWVYSIGSEIYGSPVYSSSTIFIGTDQGFLYALENSQKGFFAVYQPSADNQNYPVLDPGILSFLQEKGFQKLDSSDLEILIEASIKEEKPGVIVFAYDIIPRNIIGNDPTQGLIKKFLDKGGKIVWLGSIPNLYTPNGKGYYDFSKVAGEKLVGVDFSFPKESGNYFSKATQEGLNMGLPEWLKTTNVTIKEGNGIIPLAIDEFGRISAWIKKFNARPGSGFVSFRNWANGVPATKDELEVLYQVAVYGLK